MGTQVVQNKQHLFHLFPWPLLHLGQSSPASRRSSNSPDQGNVTISVRSGPCLPGTQGSPPRHPLWAKSATPGFLIKATVPLTL